VRSRDVGGHAELTLDIVSQADGQSRDRQRLGETITGTHDWTRY